MTTTCIAFRESRVDKSVVYVPCACVTKNTRFCGYHERAYRELVLGITMATKHKEPVHKRSTVPTVEK